jgi:hypothetical protein
MTVAVTAVPVVEVVMAARWWQRNEDRCRSAVARKFRIPCSFLSMYKFYVRGLPSKQQQPIMWLDGAVPTPIRDFW